jgi:hypothetical protein
MPAVLAFACSIPGLAGAQDWVEFVHLTDRFAIMFPTEPEITETTHVSANGVRFPARIYFARGGASSYSVTVADYTDAQRRHRERPDGTDASSSEQFWVMDVRASVAHVANGFRHRGGEVTYDGWVDIDKIEGHQLQITNPDGSRSFIGIHLNAGRLYILESTVPRGAPAPELFRSSMQFLNENGEHIRYTYDPDGQRIDIRVRPLGDVPEGVRRVVMK